ncbi:transcriptional regulator, IclR family [Methylobacterium sp. 4-46]|uniref:IclR family transcriptional regulator n=1 Tax=unclassified Methylobacterium TaxID=2615210 RepID=UPI000165CAD7|nr:MULTISPECIES: IclR family transcriptional regulator [Methylobacterium]ACA19240.1 transcriptional regulator, IclR family [Methylobacterium sp. 4-46]WFT78447.1 IclR family transcriptional regulator [Methylobacterium nodulans]
MTGKASTPGRGPAPGSQTLLRGLDVLEAVAAGATDLAALSAALGTTRSTTHRLAASLVERRYLNFVPREGYSLGPKLLELGFRAQQSVALTRVARPHLERLSAICEDTIHLGVLDGSFALYLDKIPGRRRIEISSRVGERQPVWSTGLGKALILDLDEAGWRGFFAVGEARGARRDRDLAAWLARMRAYAADGIAFDEEENEPEVRCVAAPIRAASGAIVAALSVSSTMQYLDDARVPPLAAAVREAADAISRALGWDGGRPRTGGLDRASSTKSD